jgi:hypothetical protein
MGLFWLCLSLGLGLFSVASAASNDVNLLPFSISSVPIHVGSSVSRLKLDAAVAQTTMVRCEVVASGFGSLLLNFETASHNVVGSALTRVATAQPITITWINNKASSVAFVSLVGWGGLLSVQGITAWISVSTAFVPGSTYRYSLAAQSSSQTLTAANTVSRSTATDLQSTFDVVALPYTLEDGCVTLLIRPSQVQTCYVTNAKPSPTDCQAQQRDMPDVFITQNITTGIFHNFFVSNISAHGTSPPPPNSSDSFYLQTALYAMHLMH